MRYGYFCLLLLALSACQSTCLISKKVIRQQPVYCISYIPDTKMVYREEPLVFVKLINGADTLYGINLLVTANVRASGIPPGQETDYTFYLINGQSWQARGQLTAQKIPIVRRYKLTGTVLVPRKAVEQLSVTPLSYLRVDQFAIDFKPYIARRIKNQVSCLATFW